MKVAQVAAFFSALAVLAGIILFGGLLILPHTGKSKAEVVDVSIEEEKKPDVTEEDKPKELEVQKQAAPEPPPEMKEEAAAPLDLSQLELALNPDAGAGGGDFMSRMPVSLSAQVAAVAGGAAEEIFAMGDLDQPPRVVFQPAPQYPQELKKKKLQGTVHVLFIVDKDGRVKDPKVQRSDNPAFDPHAVNAVKRWRFEAGKVNGQPVPFRMRVPITFAL